MKNDRVFKAMRQYWMIIGVAVLVILAVVLLTLHLYFENKAGILSQFEDHQFAHTLHLANQIESFFEARSQELRALSLLVSREEAVFKKRKTEMEHYSKMMEYVKAIVIYDGTGKITYTTGDNAIRLNGSKESLSWAKNMENRGKILGLPVVQPDSFMFLLAAPLYRNSRETGPPESNGEFAGVVVLIVDLNGFFSSQLRVLGLRKDLYQVWILGREGSLLYPSQHTEMVQRNVFQRNESCQQCHASFGYVEKILKEKSGIVDYELKNHLKKVATFTPMDFEETSWIVVVNSSYDEVTGYIKKNLREHLSLLGVVVLACILGTASVIRIDRLKVRAEEEVKHFRDKRVLEDKVRQSEVLYRTIVENAHDAIWTVDTDGYITFVNRTGEEISGYKAPELVGKHFESLIPPEDLPRTKGLFVDILHGQAKNFEARFNAKDGRIRLLSVNAVPLDEGGTVTGMFNIGRDVTEQRNVEKALQESEKQLRYLSSQLLTAQDAERRRISKELHDELGGALSVLKLRLSFIRKKLEHDPVTAGEECRTISEYIDQVIENVRRLSRDLAPSILEDAGLSAALRWLITNPKKNYEIKTTLGVVDIDHLFSGNVQIIIYRIVQEALTNIGKHAHAKNVSIVIEKYNNGVSFSIEDDGVGFDVLRAAAVNRHERGLGLAIMEERARMLRGSLEIWSEKGKGTRITFRVPVEREGSA
jgi:PAS domain S-box-containing protein